MEDVFSADENVKIKKKLSFMIQGQREIRIKKSYTMLNLRKDRYGNLIIKGGNHRICFRDKIEGEKNRLCDYINIDPIKTTSQIQTPISDESKKKFNNIVKLKTNSLNEDENCSCACKIF